MASASAKDDATQKLVDELREVQKWGSTHDLRETARKAADALEAAQRPPVSPEVLTDVLMEVMAWPRPSAHRLASDILARFSFPSQPVYDEEAIAKWLCSQSCARVDGSCWRVGTSAERDEHRADAAALVAALQSGELT